VFESSLKNDRTSPVRHSLDKVAVEEIPTANGPADYGLFVRGRLLGIIEAKKVTVNPQNVLEHLSRSNATLKELFMASIVGMDCAYRFFMLYASNGTIIWHLDVRPAKRVIACGNETGSGSFTSTKTSTRKTGLPVSGFSQPSLTCS
jgi:type I site-specific restriction endonuclease